MHHRICTLLCLALLAGFGNSASASLITFGNTDIDLLELAGSQSEDGFSYQATGLGWELQTMFGNLEGALATRFNDSGSAVGDQVEFTRTGGGVFTFDSIDFATGSDVKFDNVTISGYLAGNLVGFVEIAVPTPSPSSFQWVAGFLGSIDLLRIEVTATGDSAVFLDNLNLTAEPFQTVIPEPATAGLLGVAALCAFWRRRRTSPRG